MHDATVGVRIVADFVEHGFRGLYAIEFGGRGYTLQGLTRPSGWTMFRPIWRSTVSSGSSQTTSPLEDDERRHRPRKLETYSGKFPFTPATYSLRTLPSMNSFVRLRARSAFKGMIMSPEVRRSSLFTAANASASYTCC